MRDFLALWKTNMCPQAAYCSFSGVILFNTFSIPIINCLPENNYMLTNSLAKQNMAVNILLFHMCNKKLYPFVTKTELNKLTITTGDTCVGYTLFFLENYDIHDIQIESSSHMTSSSCFRTKEHKVWKEENFASQLVAPNMPNILRLHGLTRVRRYPNTKTQGQVLRQYQTPE